MNLDTFLRSGFNFKDDEYELRLHHIIFNATLTLVIAMLFLLAIVRYIENNYPQFIADIIIILSSAIGLFYIRKSKTLVYKAFPILITAFFILVSFSFVNTNMFIVGTSWYITFLLPAYFLGGYRAGFIATIASLLAITILSFTGENQYTFFQYFYTLIPMIISVLFMSIYERRNEKVKELLYQKNISLEKEIDIKTQEQIRLLQQSQNLAQVLEKSTIELYIVDIQTDHFLYVNNGATNALGYTQEEMLHKSVYDINPSLTVETVSKLKKASKSVPNIMNITEHQRKDGTTYGVQSYIHGITYDKKDAYVIYDIKISDEKKAQEEILRQKQNLAKQAHYDTLTNLPNRALFYDRLSHAITKSKRSNKKFALMFIDLDKFKEINDTLGHDVGDIVLIEIALRLKNSLREVDTVARLAGDEFLVIIEDIESIESVELIAQKILETLSVAIVVDKINLYVTSSIGISIYPDHTEDPKLLIKHADQAMYKAKNIGKNNFVFYNG